MKILNRKDFLALPDGVLYSKYEPCIFGPLEIKGESWENDFLTQQIADAVDCNDSGEFFNILLDAKETGNSFALDFYSEGRDGLFDEDQLFAVWEHADISALISRLNLLLPSKTDSGTNPDEGPATGGDVSGKPQV